MSSKQTRSLYWKTVPKVLRMRKYDIEDYTENIDPFQVFQVDPTEISKLTGREYPHLHRLKLIGSVQGGEWDQKQERDIYPGYPYDFYNAERFEETVLYQSLQERFVDEVAWEDTKLVQQVLELIDQGHSVWHGCSSRPDVSEQCAKLDALYTSIQKTGYRHPADSKKSWGIIARTLNQIVVDIGRDGDLLFADGRHRLAIAKILGLDTVPVVVLVRHRQYMNQLVSDSAFRDQTTLEQYDEQARNCVEYSKSKKASDSTTQ
ncbi:ParB N-terminal domain-containing protein [Halalkalicoccus salilacus]|uniref:ParB N-terminal domain-containing protein n=1 Tax=Halalkalicoccus salilacus TaxID=3117459 RepID=UPI00300F6C5A